LIRLDSGSFVICNVYCNPPEEGRRLKDLLENLARVTSKFRDTPVVIIGDYNRAVV